MHPAFDGFLRSGCSSASQLCAKAGVERRIANDGGAYTLQEFHGHIGQDYGHQFCARAPIHNLTTGGEAPSYTGAPQPGAPSENLDEMPITDDGVAYYFEPFMIHDGVCQ